MLICTQTEWTDDDYRKLRKRRKLFRFWYTQRAVKRQWIVTALKHENGALSHVMQSVVEELDDLSSFTEEEMKEMIMEKLKKRKLTFSEIQYIEDILKRSKKRDWTNSSTSSLVYFKPVIFAKCGHRFFIDS